MIINKNNTVFDLLAYMCSFFNKEEERIYAIQWTTAEEKHIRRIIDTYKNFLAVILNASAREYKFDDTDILYLNRELERIKKEKDKKDIFWLTVEVEKRLDMYSDWQNRGVVYCLDPLNTNVEETGIAIYPRIMPFWDTVKSERNRERRLNTNFTNYMVLRAEDISPFEIVMHYWNDEGFLKKKENGWELRVGLAPVMDNAELKIKEYELPEGNVVKVEGLANKKIVTDRVLRVFDKMFSENYGIIVFPEALGTEELLSEIKNRMRKHPELCTFVVAPTICCDGANILVVLGPGGIECLRQKKTTPAILITKDGNARREELKPDKQVHLLITHELGLTAFPICAELLDPDYYHLIVDTAWVDTIICASFSPGVAAFYDTLLKGISVKLLQLFINTCSAKAVSRKDQMALPIGFVQVPYSDKKVPVYDMERECFGECSKGICYFDIIIEYKDEKFKVESIHRKCA